MSDDHDAWLASLAGRGENEDKESAMLRRIMLEAEQRQVDQESLDHDWQRLRFALRREARSERPAWFSWQLFAQAATIFLVVGGVVTMSLQNPTSSPIPDADDVVVMRGRFAQEIAVSEPAAAAAGMAERLRALGTVVEVKHQPERSELRVRLAYPVTPAVKALFAEQQIELPRQGDLYVLFLPSAR